MNLQFQGSTHRKLPSGPPMPCGCNLVTVVLEINLSQNDIILITNTNVSSEPPCVVLDQTHWQISTHVVMICLICSITRCSKAPHYVKSKSTMRESHGFCTQPAISAITIQQLVSRLLSLLLSRCFSGFIQGYLSLGYGWSCVRSLNQINQQ